MSACRYRISDNNPNDGIGGGGCLCGDAKNPDQSGPFAIFYAVETDSNLSPHAVLCAGCARHFVDALDGGAEALSAGESGGTAIELSPAAETDAPVTPESPVVDDIDQIPARPEDDEEIVL